MYYCKELYSLSVLSLYEGELLGKVDKLYFDKKLKKLVEIELVGEDGAKLILPAKNIYHVGKNVITVKNNQAVLLKDAECSNCLAPINSKAYSINGEFLGVVQEVYLNDNFLTGKISLENDIVLDVEKLATCGKNTIIFYTGEDKINIKNFTPNKSPKNFKTKQVQIATTLPIEDLKANVVPVDKPKQTIIQSSDFLIGRICMKDIFNFNNEILIKAQTVVNKKNLKEINRFGKLRELMLYLK